jgi:hypothetical protein
VSVFFFITPGVFVVFSLTSAALCCFSQRLSNGRGGGDDDGGRTRALLNVVIEMLKGLLMPSSGEQRGDVEGVFKFASSRGGCWC